jgi:peroxiredoxin
VRPKAAFFLVLLLGSLFLAYTLFVRDSGKGRGAEEPRPGAPPFTLPRYGEEGEITLDGLEGQVVVLNFWSSYCNSCRLEAPELERAWKSYRGRGVTFVGINVGEGTEDVARFVEEFSLTYPIALDTQGETLFFYGVRVVPSTVLVGRDGTIAFVYEGPLTERQLASLIDHSLRL